MFSRENMRRTAAEEQAAFLQEAATTITQISRRKECPRVSVFLFSDTGHLLLYPFSILPESKRSYSFARVEKGEKKVKETHPRRYA